MAAASADARRRRRWLRRPNAEEALEDPYFAGLHNPAREPVAEPISKLEFEFEKRKLSVEEARAPAPPTRPRPPRPPPHPPLPARQLVC